MSKGPLIPPAPLLFSFRTANQKKKKTMFSFLNFSRLHLPFQFPFYKTERKEKESEKVREQKWRIAHISYPSSKSTANC